MNLSTHRASPTFLQCAVFVVGFLLVPSGLLVAESPAQEDTQGQSRPGQSNATPCAENTLGSPYIPVDSWIYHAIQRLYSLGFVDTAYQGMRPWTRASLSHILGETAYKFQTEDTPGIGSANDQAQGIYDALLR